MRVTRVASARMLAGVLLSLLAAACGARLPPPEKLMAHCPPVSEQVGASGREDVFFVAPALPDCRDGSLDFAPYRYPEMSYGLSTLTGPEAAPWKTHRSVRYTPAAWREMLSGRFDREIDRRVLVYVHGYYNDYEEVLERGLKLSRLAPAGTAVVVYNWPSRNRLQSYSYDEANMAWAQDGLDALMVELAGQFSDITLVSHSMGAHGVINSARYLERAHSSLAPNLKRIVLASPDVDRHEMLRKGGAIDDLVRSDRRVLIYASSADRALKASRANHGFARLGSSGCKYDVEYARRQLPEDALCHLTKPRQRLAIVDTTKVDASDPRNHTDFVDSCPARRDLAQFLADADAFPLRRIVARADETGYVIPHGLAEQLGLCPDT